MKKLILALALCLTFGFVAIAQDDTDSTDMTETETTEPMDETMDETMDDTEDAAMDDADMEDAAMEDAEMDDAAGSVVDIAAGSPEHTTLVAAVEAAGLVETLSGEGPFTVLAPTDAAFETALGELGLSAEELLANEDLSSILTYHVIPGNLLAADVIAAVEEAGGAFEAETVNGATLSITVVDGVVTINDTATVTTADLAAGNGVVHVIDGVLLP